MLTVLLSVVDTLILTQSSDTITEVPASLYALASKLGFAGEVYMNATVTDALQRAEKFASNETAICITGSVYIVGEARTYFGLDPTQMTYPTE